MNLLFHFSAGELASDSAPAASNNFSDSHVFGQRLTLPSEHLKVGYKLNLWIGLQSVIRSRSRMGLVSSSPVAVESDTDLMGCGSHVLSGRSPVWRASTTAVLQQLLERSRSRKATRRTSWPTALALDSAAVRLDNAVKHGNLLAH